MTNFIRETGVTDVHQEERHPSPITAVLPAGVFYNMSHNFEPADSKLHDQRNYAFEFYRGIPMRRYRFAASDHFADFIFDLGQLHSSMIEERMDFFGDFRVKLTFAGGLMVTPNTFLRTAKLIAKQFTLREVTMIICDNWLYPSTNKLTLENELDVMVWTKLYLFDNYFDYTPEVLPLHQLHNRYGYVLPCPPEEVYEDFFREMFHLPDLGITPNQIVRIVPSDDGVWATLFDDEVSTHPWTPFVNLGVYEDWR